MGTQWLAAIFTAATLALPTASGWAQGKDCTQRNPLDLLTITGQTGRVESVRKVFGDANYAGSDNCKSCHAKQHAEWQATWHVKMERWPSPEIIVGDFNDRLITYKDIAVKAKDGKEEKLTFHARAHRQGDKFFFTMLDKDTREWDARCPAASRPRPSMPTRIDLIIKQKQAAMRAGIDDVERLLAKIPANKPAA